MLSSKKSHCSLDIYKKGAALTFISAFDERKQWKAHLIAKSNFLCNYFLLLIHTHLNVGAFTSKGLVLRRLSTLHHSKRRHVNNRCKWG